MAANLFEEWAKRSLKAAGDEMAKAQMLTATMSAASVVELDFDDALAIYGEDDTPVLNMIGRTKARAITHRHREATARVPASNASNEGAAAKSPVSVAPSAVTNTCQIVKGTIGVSASAIQEAQNGIYGTDTVDEIAFQIETEVRGILKDIELELLYGVLSTTDPRRMKGLVGAVGTWDGFIQTTRTDNGDAAFSETVFKNWLESIWNQQAGKYPNVVLGSLASAGAINAFTTNYRWNISSEAELLALPAGSKVKKYVAPWNDLVDIVAHPQNVDSGTHGQNWMAALCTDNLRLADFRPLSIKQVLATDVDGQEWEVVYEGTLECKVEKSHGILRNFDQINP